MPSTSQSWLKVLKADKRAIFTAASKAQQATDWLTQRAGASAPRGGGGMTTIASCFGVYALGMACIRLLDYWLGRRRSHPDH